MNLYLTRWKHIKRLHKVKKIIKVLSKSWLQHLVFWMLSFYFIGSYFSISGLIKLIDFIYSGFFHIPLITLVYINIRYLTPKFLQQEKYFPYMLLSVFNVGLAYFLHELLFEIIIPLIPGEFFGVFYIVSFTDMTVLITIFSIYLVISTLLKLSKSWYKLQQIEKEKLSLELNSLKMQINPHFLFNSLNSIYSLAMKKSERTPSVILELSSLLRYMIYEVSDEKVMLSKEIESLQNYLDLQRLRVSENVRIDMSIEGEVADQKISPLLFFPLVENSFKHGLKSETDKYVDIQLALKSHKIAFRIKNDKGNLDDPEDKKYGGIGLENVKKRLELIYGDQASFEVDEDESSFEVSLNFPLND